MFLLSSREICFSILCVTDNHGFVNHDILPCGGNIKKNKTFYLEKKIHIWVTASFLMDKGIWILVNEDNYERYISELEGKTHLVADN